MCRHYLLRVDAETTRLAKTSSRLAYLNSSSLSVLIRHPMPVKKSASTSQRLSASSTVACTLRSFRQLQVPALHRARAQVCHYEIVHRLCLRAQETSTCSEHSASVHTTTRQQLQCSKRTAILAVVKAASLPTCCLLVSANTSACNTYTANACRYSPY